MKAEERSALLAFILFLALIISTYSVVSHCNGSLGIPVIINFGDSNSDTGGFCAGWGLDFEDPYGRTFFGRPAGRASDGRLVIDFLCDYLEIPFLTPYLDSVAPDFSNGANFAIVGAATLPNSAAFNLGVQIRQFRHFHKRLVDIKSKGGSNLVGAEELKNALYTFDIGQNDLSGSFYFLPYEEAIQRIPSFISEIRDAILAIYELGGKNFWIHNTGPLGCLPRELALRHNSVNRHEFDEYGCLDTLNEGAKAFNVQLHSLCQQLRTQMKNSTIVYIDMYTIKYDLIANASSYGFKHPLMACCGHGGAPYNYDYEERIPCQGDGYSVCEEGTPPYVSWDGVHYTEAANAIVAGRCARQHKTELFSSLYSRVGHWYKNQHGGIIIHFVLSCAVFVLRSIISLNSMIICKL